MTEAGKSLRGMHLTRQALRLEELPHFLEDVRIAREAYEKRLAVAARYRNHEEEPVLIVP